MGQGHYKVIIGGEVFGRGTQEECNSIVRMHKTVLNGHRKESKISIHDGDEDRVRSRQLSFRLQAPRSSRIQNECPKRGTEVKGLTVLESITIF